MPDKKHMIDALTAFRRELHRHPEISGQEADTASRVYDFLKGFSPDSMRDHIGGHGLLAEFRGKAAGPLVMFRAELDALPIAAISKHPYRSAYPGKGHLCGHDGHMAMVAGLAYHLAEKRPGRGRVVLLFQPSEEDGSGAQRIISDPAFKAYEPDRIFALHNLPGYPLHAMVVSQSHFAAASRGMHISITGKSSHAAEPEKGVNPAQGMARMLMKFKALIERKKLFSDFTLITPIHARLGSLAYGTSPGEGVIHLTLRSYLNRDMELLRKETEKIIGEIASQEKLHHQIKYEEVFPATVNDPDCKRLLENAAKKQDLRLEVREKPFKWSEDFGHFTAKYSGALFGLGSGTSQPALHNPDYDFPDTLIPTGIKIFKNVYEQLLNK